MKTANLTFPLLLSVLLTSAGCGSDKTRTVYVIEDDPYADDPYADDPAEYDAAVPEPAPFVPPFEAFEVAIGQSITFGSFVIDLKSARMRPRESAYNAYATVTVDFHAHNTSSENAWPFDRYSTGDRVLDAGGKTFFGEVDAAEVPGLRDGDGSVSWSIDEDLTPELLRAAVLTFGDADRNQAVVPLAALAEARTLADIPVASTFTIPGVRSTTFEITKVSVQFNSREDNEPLRAGTAWLVLEGALSAEPEVSSEYWNDENAFVQRPDGVSVVPEYFSVILDASERADLLLQFAIAQPVSGTYTFGVTAPDLTPVTQTIVVP